MKTLLTFWENAAGLKVIISFLQIFTVTTHCLDDDYLNTVEDARKLFYNSKF